MRRRIMMSAGGGGGQLPDTKGVYAYFADGSVSSATSYTSAQKANIWGVAVTDTYDGKLVRFVISKYQYPNTIMFGAYGVDLTGKVLVTSDSTTALKDMKGKTNSKAIIEACAGKTGSAAAVTCLECAKTTHFPNGEGYCPSLGEWQVAYNNKSAIDIMMTAIGGTAIPEGKLYKCYYQGAHIIEGYPCISNNDKGIQVFYMTTTEKTTIILGIFLICLLNRLTDLKHIRHIVQTN